jgi:hypothetical protein
MPSMILTSTQLRRWRACKQGLAGKGFLDVVEAVGRVAGVYGTAPTCYLSLAARVAGFHRKDLDTELYTARRLVRLRCMRASVYAVTLDQFPVVIGAMADRVERDLGRLVVACGITEEEVTAVAGRVLEVLANSEPLTVAELRVAGVSPSGWRREAFGFVIGLLCARRMLVRATVRGSWRSDNFAYARLSDWLPAHDLTAVAPEEARVRSLVPTYAPMDLRPWTTSSGGADSPRRKHVPRSLLWLLRSSRLPERTGVFHSSPLLMRRTSCARPTWMTSAYGCCPCGIAT